MSLPVSRRMLLCRIGRGTILQFGDIPDLDDLVVHYDPDDTANLADVAHEMTTLLLDEFEKKKKSFYWNSVAVQYH